LVLPFCREPSGLEKVTICIWASLGGYMTTSFFTVSTTTNKFMLIVVVETVKKLGGEGYLLIYI
jgi:hypothetical protein